MISTIIIDDEAKGRVALREKILAYCPQIEILAEAANGQEALLLIQHHKPQLVFLDIEMPRMNGFEMLNELPEKNFHIIFTYRSRMGIRSPGRTVLGRRLSICR